MIKNLFVLPILLALGVCSFAQQIPVVIQGATIHLGNGQLIKNGIIGFDNGKIAFVDSVMRNSYKNARIIDASGKHIYPGLILLNTYLGLNEIDAVRSTRDYNETGEINPNVRALIAYNTDSKVVPTAKFNGITHMQVVPQGGLVSGTSCVVKTEANNWEDAATVSEDGVHINWPEINYYSNNKSEQQKRIAEQQEKLQTLITQSKQYKNKSTQAEVNLRLQAMQGVLTGEMVFYIHSNSPKGIIEAIAFCKQNQLPKVVLVVNSEAYVVADEIKQSGYPVIVNLVNSLPAHNQSDVDQPYKTAAQLTNKGITVALGFSGSWESRNVMFNAGTCAAYGITPEQALQLITQNAAIICGATQLGVLQPGKNATIVISEGDILDMKSSKVTQLFIDGIEASLENSQTELYKKYSEKYHIPMK